LGSNLSSIIKPYYFSIARWELESISREVSEGISGGGARVNDEVGVATNYFALGERIDVLRSEIAAINAGSEAGDSALLEAELSRLEAERVASEDGVERILEEQIAETLTEQGIFHPAYNCLGLRAIFPPVNFELEAPPHLLVVSPRDRIESIREITLRQDISPEEMEDIESRVDKLGVSSLVMMLGGIATFPSFVTNDAGLRFTVDTAVEEWLHQYLAFKPLGFSYLLHLTGLSSNYEVATMNETLAGMASREIGAMVCEKYYPQYETGAQGSQVTDSGFDFNREMREIRKDVDEYLARGEIIQAEQFMEQKRQYLASQGYHIRKLNQAYFAFNGKYADKPTSISPIGAELEELRGHYTSLKEFLDAIAGMNSRQDLLAALAEVQGE